MRPRFIRCAIGSGPNAENNGVNVPCAFIVPERSDVQVGDAPGERRHAGARAEAAASHRVGEIGSCAERASHR